MEYYTSIEQINRLFPAKLKIVCKFLPHQENLLTKHSILRNWIILQYYDKSQLNTVAAKDFLIEDIKSVTLPAGLCPYTHSQSIKEHLNQLKIAINFITPAKTVHS